MTSEKKRTKFKLIKAFIQEVRFEYRAWEIAPTKIHEGLQNMILCQVEGREFELDLTENEVLWRLIWAMYTIKALIYYDHYDRSVYHNQPPCSHPTTMHLVPTVYPSPRSIRVRDSTPELIWRAPPVWVKSRGSSISPTANFSPHMWCQVALSQGSGRPPQTQVESVGCWACLREFVLNLMGGH